MLVSMLDASGSMRAAPLEIRPWKGSEESSIPLYCKTVTLYIASFITHQLINFM